MTRTVTEQARRLNHLYGKKGRLPSLFVMTDSKRLPDPSHIIAHLPAGSAIIVRAFSKSDKVIIINKCKALCKKHKVKLLVSDDFHLALSYGLDGVHLSARMLRRLTLSGKLKRPKKELLISAACHNELAINQANIIHVDYAFLSPVFQTRSHAKARPLGVIRFQTLARKSKSHAIALGGIQCKTAQRLCHTKVNGFAGIEAFTN